MWSHGLFKMKCTWCSKHNFWVAPFILSFFVFFQKVCFQRKLKFSYIVSQNSSFRMPPFTSVSVLRITKCFQPLIPVLCHCPTVYLTFPSLRWIAHSYQLSTPCYWRRVLAFSLACTAFQVWWLIFARRMPVVSQPQQTPAIPNN